MSTTTWLDGRVLDAASGEARVPLADPGVLVGHGVFETTKALEGPALALGRHLRRLRRSAELARLAVPLEDAELRGAFEAVLGEHRRRGGGPAPGEGFVRLRLTVTAGGVTAVTATDAPAWPATTTVALVDAPLNERSPLAGAKTISHLESTWGRLEAERLGVGEVLRTNTRGRLGEGAASNLFLVLDGVLVTPSTATGCLAGVTRGLVCELVPVVERDDLTPADLARAEEVFVTSSTRDVHPVAAVDGRRLDAPGPRTAAAADALRARFAETPDP